MPKVKPIGTAVRAAEMWLYGRHSLEALALYFKEGPTGCFMIDQADLASREKWRRAVSSAVRQVVWTSEREEDHPIHLVLRQISQKVRQSDARNLAALCGSERHQGCAVKFDDRFQFPNFSARKDSLADWLGALPRREGSSGYLKVLVLDRLQDPQNTGAIFRTAEALGIDGIITSTHESGEISAAVHHVSTGASLLMPVKQETNLGRSIEVLKKEGFWTVSTHQDGEPLGGFHFDDRNWALIIGAEGRGVKKSLLNNTDFTVAIPMQGFTGSLNASVSAAIFLYSLISQNSRP